MMTAEHAIFHLCLLGMYADGNLALSEDSRISVLMRELGISDETGSDGVFLSEAYNRVRAASESDEATAAFLTQTLKPALAGDGQRERAVAFLKQVVTADGNTTSGEANLQGLVKFLL